MSPSQADRRRDLSRPFRWTGAWILRQRPFWLDYTILAVVLIAVVGGLLAVYPQYYRDSAHYLGMSLWFTGMPQADALDFVNAKHLAHGYETNASVDALFNWGLVKPRVVLSALSVPFVLLFGEAGLGVTTVLITVILVFVAYKFLAARFSRIAAVATLVLMMSSFYIMIFNIAMLTESLSALWGVISLIAAYKYQQRHSPRWIVAMVAITALSGFTRQATFIVAGAFVIAWIGSLFRRGDRRDWGVPALAIAGTAIVVQLLQSWLFPTFSQVEQYLRMTGSSSIWEALAATPGLVRSILAKEAHSYITEDQGLVVFIALSLVSMVIYWRRSESHLLLGAILGTALYNITNGNATDFRYAIPGLVFFLVSIALLLSEVSRRMGMAAQKSGAQQPADYPPLV